MTRHDPAARRGAPALPLAVSRSLALVALLAAACGGPAVTLSPARTLPPSPSPSTGAATLPPSTTAATAAPASAPTGVATASASSTAGACNPPTPSRAAATTPSDPLPAIALKVVATGLNSPIGIVASPDTSGRLFVVEQGGTIRILESGALLERPYLDVGDLITSGGEQGLLGLAFHPAFACNDRFFVNYTDGSGDTVVAEYRASAADPDRAEPDPVVTLLHIDQPFPNHNGGAIVFGPDGLLYVGMGDGGGGGGDPRGNGQRTDTLLAKLLRIDVDETSPDHPYVAPPDNCAGCPAGTLPEIYAYGVRNPWRFSFDRATGDLWIGDVGQGRYEEVDHLPLTEANGANFGWNRMEGRHCYPGGNTCSRLGLTLPVAEYDHSAGDCSVTGGYVYRGSAIPSLAGRYVFADYCSGTIRQVAADGPGAGADPTVLLESGRNITSFGESTKGELFVADVSSGEILQIVVMN